MKSAGKARSNGLYRHIRTSKEIIRNLLNDYYEIHYNMQPILCQHIMLVLCIILYIKIFIC